MSDIAHTHPTGRRPPRDAATRRPPRDAAPLEDLLGGRVLAWASGATLLTGLALLGAIAVSRGWIGPGARTLFAGVLSATLAGAGAWLHERRGRSDAARAGTAAGVAGLFVTAVLGARVYAVLPAPAGVALAALAGALAVGLALRWEARGLAALGVLGALASPILAGAAGTGTVVLLWIGTAAAAALLLARGWDWLALGAFAVVTPQWCAWSVTEAPVSTGAVLVAAVAFGLLAAVLAVGFAVRTGAERLGPASAWLAVLNAGVVGASGWVALRGAGDIGLAGAWLAGLAGVHVAAGALLRSRARVCGDLSTLLVMTGVALGDLAVATLVRGPAQPLVWLLGALAAACIAAPRVAGWEEGPRRLVLDGAGLAAVAYLLGVELDGAPLAAAWAAEAAALAGIARRTREPTAGLGALGMLGLARSSRSAWRRPPRSCTASPTRPAPSSRRGR